MLCGDGGTAGTLKLLPMLSSWSCMAYSLSVTPTSSILIMSMARVLTLLLMCSARHYPHHLRGGEGGGMNRAQLHHYLLSFTLQGEKGDRGERVSDYVCLVPLPPRVLERAELWGCHAGAQPPFHRVPLDWSMGQCLKGSRAPR